MDLTLLYANKLEGEALSYAIQNKGYHIKLKHMDFRAQPPVSLHKSLFLIIDTNLLFQMNRSKIDRLFNFPDCILLLGRLSHLFWFFKFNYKSSGFISKKEEVHHFYTGLNELQRKKIFLSKKVISFIKKDNYSKQKVMFNHDLIQHLTKTELEIMSEITNRKTTQQIADNWHRSHN